MAIGQRDGPDGGLEALRTIPDPARLRRYPFYPAAMGELELKRGNLNAAQRHFTSAAALARNPLERRYLQKRVQACAATRSA